LKAIILAAKDTKKDPNFLIAARIEALIVDLEWMRPFKLC